jgi:hypothetical protein
MRLSKALHPSLIPALLVATTHMFAQDKPVRLTFDVASIRPSSPGASDRVIEPLPGTGYTVQNMPTKLMIVLTYKAARAADYRRPRVAHRAELQH